VDDGRLAAVLVGFARTLVADLSIQTTLDELAAQVVDVLPVTGAGVLLMDGEREHHFLAATDEVIVRIEGLQVELGEGPCLEAHHTGRRVVIPDLAADVRFPRFSPEAVTCGLAAVFSFPLRLRGRQLGALELYGAEPTVLSEADLEGAQTLADVMAAYLHNARVRSDAAAALAQLQHQALHDPLTGLPNRVLLRDRLDRAVRGSYRTPRTFVGVLFLDVDDLKRVNDGYGHAAGDAMLRWVATRAQDVLRPGDTMARLSGDEFVIICEALTQEDQAEEVARRVRASLEEPLVVGTLRIPAGVSIGIGFAGPGRGSGTAAMRAADAAMYAAKRGFGGGSPAPRRRGGSEAGPGPDEVVVTDILLP
jgi:diguanylate cyclase (GGDEF)-like protein